MHSHIPIWLVNPIYTQVYFIGLSLLFIALELPLAMNRIKPNPYYGFRVGRTLSDERVWYLVNSHAAKGTILTGIITIILAVVLRLAAVPIITYVCVCAPVLFGGLVVVMVETLIYMKRIP